MTVSFELQALGPVGQASGSQLRGTTELKSPPPAGDIAANTSFLATTAATPRERRFAWAVVALSAVFFLAAIPFAKLKLLPVPAFIPTYESALIITDIVTAILLLGQFTRIRSRAILALAAGYFFDALIIVVHFMSFPGVFSDTGLLGAGPQTTAWLYIAWHAGFPCFVIAYALLRDTDEPSRPAAPALALAAAAFVTVVVLAVTVATTAGQAHLPAFMQGSSYTPTAIFFLGGAWVVSIAALVVLWWKGIRTVLEVWIAVVMVAWVCDIALSAVFNGGRYDLGFYVGRGYGLLAASFVLAVILLETTGLHSRLASTAAQLDAEVRDTKARHERTEAQLRQAQKMEAIGNLTGGMAHDFNNLLAIVIGNLDMLVSRRKADSEVRELGGEALDAALRGADLTQRLLAFARRQPLQPKRLDLNPLIANITKLLERTLGETVEISLDLDPGLWAVVVDPAQLDAALTNLATNARDAMPSGGSLIIVTGNRHLDADYAALHAELTPGDYALIEVSDTGSGMRPEVAARIFDPFFTTKDEGKGTGLGLSMVYGFMKQSGGHINVYTEPGIGTTFRLYFPRAEIAEASSEKTATAAARMGHGETVLAVEDNPALRRVVARQLRELGYRVIEAENAAAALVALERERVDLLFSDVVMPGGVSGVELAAAAADRWTGLRVLLTSGFPDAKFNHAEQSSGRQRAAFPWRLLNKPYRREDLARTIAEVLAQP